MYLDLNFKDVLEKTNKKQTLEKSHIILMLFLKVKKRHHLIISWSTFVFMSVS